MHIVILKVVPISHIFFSKEWFVGNSSSLFMNFGERSRSASCQSLVLERLLATKIAFWYSWRFSVSSETSIDATPKQAIQQKWRRSNDASHFHFFQSQNDSLWYQISAPSRQVNICHSSWLICFSNQPNVPGCLNRRVRRLKLVGWRRIHDANISPCPSQPQKQSCYLIPWFSWKTFDMLSWHQIKMQDIAWRLPLW